MPASNPPPGCFSSMPNGPSLSSPHKTENLTGAPGCMSSHVRSATGTMISCLPLATPADRPATLATFSVSSFLATICLISSSIGFVVSFTYSTQASGPPLPAPWGRYRPPGPSLATRRRLTELGRPAVACRCRTPRPRQPRRPPDRGPAGGRPGRRPTGPRAGRGLWREPRASRRVRLGLAARVQGAGPPGKPVEHGLGRKLGAGFLLQPAVGVEQRPSVVEADAITDRHRVQFPEDLTELLDGAQTAAHPAVGHERHGLGLPLGVGQIDRLLERRRVAVVVLGGDDHEGVGSLEALPIAGDDRIRGAPQNRGQFGVGEIDDVEVELVSGLGLGDEPAGDRGAEASLAGAADDDREMHVRCHCRSPSVLDAASPPAYPNTLEIQDPVITRYLSIRALRYNWSRDRICTARRSMAALACAPPVGDLSPHLLAGRGGVGRQPAVVLWSRAAGERQRPPRDRDRGDLPASAADPASAQPDRGAVGEARIHRAPCRRRARDSSVRDRGRRESPRQRTRSGRSF